MTVSVVHDNEIVLQEGYGYANLEEDVPVNAEQTMFRPGSVSKLFVWTAVMQLVEQGKLDLDTDVNVYLQQKSDLLVPDSYPGQPITMRHLMSHTAGFDDYIYGLFTKDPANGQNGTSYSIDYVYFYSKTASRMPLTMP